MAAAEAGAQADDQAVRGAQLAAARVLADLLTADLPVASWWLPGEIPIELWGRISSWRVGQGERTAQVLAWAAALGSTGRWEPYTHLAENAGELRVEAQVQGVPVRVAAALDVAPDLGSEVDRPDTGGCDAAGLASLRGAVAALAGLLQADRPVADWMIYRNDLSGQISSHHIDASARAAQVSVWATALGLTPCWLPYTGKPGGAWQATGAVDGVQVTVWTWLPAAPADTTGDAAGQHDGHPREVA